MEHDLSFSLVLYSSILTVKDSRDPLSKKIKIEFGVWRELYFRSKK